MKIEEAIVYVMVKRNGSMTTNQIADAIIDKNAIVNALYKNMRDNPIFKVFYLKNIDGWMTNLGHVKGLEKRDEFAKPIHFKF